MEVPDRQTTSSSNATPATSTTPDKSNTEAGDLEARMKQAGRGPDTYDRTRRTYQEASTGEAPTDWSKFDAHLTSKALRTADEAVRR